MLIFAAMAGSANAAFVLVEDFDGLTLGDLNGQNGWTASATTIDVAVDPADPLNQVYQTPTASGNARKAFGSIANNSTGTLFFRFRSTGTVNYSAGASDVAAATGFASHSSPQTWTT